MMQPYQFMQVVMGRLVLAFRSVGRLGLFTGVLVWVMLTGYPAMARAVEAPSNLPETIVQVHLGTVHGDLQFEPDHLVFMAGQRYKLVLDNPSDQKHYFTAKDFTDVIWSQKVEAAGVEVKGAIHELELKPSAQADWVFVPQKPGSYALYCSIAGHQEAGMVGTIVVEDPA